jgi:hypothetical protein
MTRTSTVEFHGYAGCLALENDAVRVVLGPQCGGRVLAYERRGVNALALDPAQAGWLPRPGAPEIDPWGGRFDIGPEKILPPHPTLWLGAWSAEVDGDTARLVSAPDPATGIQLTRTFRLDPRGSHLRCTQTMKNASGEARRCFHWGRSLSPGGGVAVVPLTPQSRFPRGYVQYEDGPRMNFAPEDPGIRARDGFLVMAPPLRHPKLGFDTEAGWLAYLMRPGLLFAKRWHAHPGRDHGDIGAFTLSIWMYRDLLCELEPIGPTERLAPGASASFTEDWWLLEHPFPASPDALDLRALAARVESDARPG